MALHNAMDSQTIEPTIGTDVTEHHTHHHSALEGDLSQLSESLLNNNSDSGQTFATPAKGFNWKNPSAGTNEQKAKQATPKPAQGFNWKIPSSTSEKKTTDDEIQGSRETSQFPSGTVAVPNLALPSNPAPSLASSDPTFKSWADFLRKEFKSDPEELENLQKLYKCDFDTLVRALIEHSFAYYVFKSEAVADLAPEFGYTPYQVTTGSPGVQRMGTELDKRLNISDPVAFWINVPLSGLDFFYNVHTFGPAKAAILQTLSWAFWRPMEDLESYCKTLKEEPCKTLCNTAKVTAHLVLDQTILLTHNTTGALLNIVDVVDYLPIKMASVALGTYLGVRNYTLFSNSDYYDGKNFWFNNDPWMLGEFLYRNNKIAALEAFFEGILSAVGLRVGSFAGGLSLISAAFQVSIAAGPTAFILTCIALHALCTRYPTTYKKLMADTIAIRKIVVEQFRPEIEKLLKIELKDVPLEQLSEKDRKKIQEKAEAKAIDMFFDFIEYQRKKYARLAEKQEGRCYRLTKSGQNLIAPAAMGAYASYAAVQQILPLIEACAPPYITYPSYVIVPALSAALVAGPSVKAQMNLTENAKVKELIEKDRKNLAVASKNDSNALSSIIVEVPASSDKKDEVAKSEADENEVSSCGTCCLTSCSCCVTASSMGIRAFSTMGTLQQTPVLDVPGGSALALALSIKGAVNGFLWTWPKVDKVVKSRWGWCFSSKKEQAVETPSAESKADSSNLKSGSKTEPKASQNSNSWFSWKNKNDNSGYRPIPDLEKGESTQETSTSSWRNCFNARKKMGC